MGVRGLSRLVRDYGLVEEIQLPKRAKARSTTGKGKKVAAPVSTSAPMNLVIDGWSFLYTFYQQTLDCVKGGQYKKFQVLLERFFMHLLRYNIRICGIILDWLSTDVYFRNRSIQRILSHHLSASEIIHQPEKFVYNPEGPIINEDLPLPFLTFITFINTLKQLQLKVYVTKDFGDKTIASFANKHNAYVLANDSDFMVYPLNQGYILLKHLDLNHGRALVFYVNALTQFFKLPLRMLPLYAVCMGTSYSSIENMTSLFADLQHQHTVSFSQSIVDLLQPIKHLSLEEATLALLTARVETNHSEHNPLLLDPWITLFQKILSIYTIDVNVQAHLLKDPKDPYGFLMKVHSDQYFYCFSLWEDYMKPSAWHLSRPLRSVAYAQYTQAKEVCERVRTLVKGEFSEIIVKVHAPTVCAPLVEALKEHDPLIFALKFLQSQKQLTCTQLLGVALATHVPCPAATFPGPVPPALYHFVALLETTLVSWSMATGMPLTCAVDGTSIFHFVLALAAMETKDIWAAVHRFAPGHKGKVIQMLESLLGFEIDTRTLVKDGIHWKLRSGKGVASMKKK